MTVSLQIDDILEAKRRCADQLRNTPCIPTKPLSGQLGCPVYLKLDNQQHTGSFKERGALNRLLTLTEQERNAGVIASSAGNHAQAVAYHATRLGIAASIVMPIGTPLIKVSRTKGFGAKVHLFGDNYDEAYEHALALAKETETTFLHPYDDPMVIAGQGTMALEMLEQQPDINTVVIPVGGGGLIGGMSLALKSLKPDLRIIAVEPEVLPSMAKSIQAKKSASPAACRDLGRRDRRTRSRGSYVRLGPEARGRVCDGE